MDVLRHAGPRAAVELRRRRPNRGHGRRAVGDRALHRGRPPAPGRPRPTTSTAPQGAQLAGRRATTTSPASTSTSPRRKLDPTKMPGEYAAIGRPQGPDDWKRDRPHRHRLAGRRDLRQGRRRRARRGPSSRDALEQRFGAQAAASTLWQRLPRRRRPRGADHRAQGKRFPYQAPPKQRAPRARRRVARTAGSLATTARGGSRGARRGAGGRPGRRSGRPARARRARRCPTRCSSRRRVGERPPAGGLRPAGRLLHPADPDGGGRPRARPDGPGSTPRAPRSPASTSTSSSAAGATTPGARRRPARTSSTPSRCRCATTTHYRFRGQCLPIEVLERTNALDAEPRPTRRRRLGDAARRAHEARPRRRPRHRAAASRCSSPSCARPTSTRSTRPSASATSTTPGAIRAPQDFQRAAAQDRLHVQLVLRRRQAHRLLQLGRQPGAGEGRRPASFPMAATYEWRDCEPRHSARRATRRSPQHPQVVDQPLPHQLEQQAGARLRAAPTRTLLSSVYRSQMLEDRVEQRLAGGQQADAAAS